MPQVGKLVDTNIIIPLFAKDPSLRWRIGHDYVCFIPVVVIGELLAGAYHSERAAFNVAEIQRLAAEFPILQCDVVTADYYARIQRSLWRKGKPIPENDVWIAALALQHQLRLITLDKHFERVEGLEIEIW